MKQSKSATAESDWIGVIPEVNEEEVDEADGEIPQEDRDVPKVTFSPFPPPPSALSLSFTLVFTTPLLSPFMVVIKMTNSSNSMSFLFLS